MQNKNNESAVRWLISKLSGILPTQTYSNIKEHADNAIRLEREQIIKAATYDPFLGTMPTRVGIDYYDQMFVEHDSQVLNGEYFDRRTQLQQELINLYESQIMDLTMMSKIELGDDVIAEIKRLKDLINE